MWDRMLATIYGLVLSVINPTTAAELAAVDQDTVRQKNRQEVVEDSTARYLQIGRVFVIGNRLTRDNIITR